MRPDNGAHDGVPGSCRFVAEISALVHAPRPCRGHAFRYRRAHVEPRSRSAYAVDVGSAGVRHAAHPSSAIEFIPRMAPRSAASSAMALCARLVRSAARRSRTSRALPETFSNLQRPPYATLAVRVTAGAAATTRPRRASIAARRPLPVPAGAAGGAIHGRAPPAAAVLDGSRGLRRRRGARHTPRIPPAEYFQGPACPPGRPASPPMALY